jgi:protein-S-isoprenylcysteine O-methyltransferase Ste14
MENIRVSAPGLVWVRWRARLGFPVAAAALWLARPTASSILVGALVAIVGLAIRAAAAGHLYKGQAVATTGPYARTRNPLYFGSALLAIGFMIAANSWSSAALVAAYYLSLYPFLMRREETELRERYGSEFDEYAKRVPLFWPRFGAAGVGTGDSFSAVQYMRNREYQTALGVAVMLIILGVLANWRR